MAKGLLIRNALVFLGAGLGGVARYGAGVLIAPASSGPFPWATFLINVTGCFAMGALMFLFLERRSLSPNHRIFLMVGVLGGYTTFSSFGAEAVLLFEQDRPGAACFYVLASVILGIVGVTAGRAVARALLSAPGPEGGKALPLEKEFPE